MSFTLSLKWSFASELAAKAVQPVVFIVLARLLTPEDFGVMTAAMMVIAFSQIFWEAGMSKALIQRQTDIEQAANAAFFINIALGIVITGGLYFFAQPIAQTFFQDDRITAVLQVMTFQVLLGALSSVQTALLQKEMGFKKLFWVRLATVSLPGLASISMALSGMGYWSLVAGTLVGQLAQTVMLWRISQWRPKFNTNLLVTREIGNFGAWVGLTGLLTWFYAWADSLFIGHYLGGHDLGLFRTGSQLVSLAFVTLFGPILPVIYSHISRLNNDKEKMRTTAESAISIVTLIAIPIAILLLAYSSELEEVVFGAKWAGIGVVIAAMAIMHGYSWIVGFNGEFYRATGKPKYETIVTAFTLLIYLGVYFYIINQGLNSFVWARMLLAMGALLLHMALLRYLLNLDIYTAYKRMIFITSVSVFTTYSIKYSANLILRDPFFLLLLGGVASGLFTVFIIFLLERKKTVAIVLKLIRKDNK
jgi:O-antigen/teichoic acid export membrane protein